MGESPSLRAFGQIRLLREFGPRRGAARDFSPLRQKCPNLGSHSMRFLVPATFACSVPGVFNPRCEEAYQTAGIKKRPLPGALRRPEVHCDRFVSILWGVSRLRTEREDLSNEG